MTPGDNSYEPWGRVPTIPAALRFPGGYVVPVLQVDRPSKEYGLDSDDDGVYTSLDDGRVVIALWKELTPAQKWHRFTHESIHATLDWQRWVEIKTRRS